MSNEHDPSRRSFLVAASGLIGPLVLGLSPFGLLKEAFAKTSGEQQELFLICHTTAHEHSTGNHYPDSIPGEFRVWTKGWAKPKSVALPFLGHSVLSSPANPRIHMARVIRS